MEVWVSRDRSDGEGKGESCINITTGSAPYEVETDGEWVWNFGVNDYAGFLSDEAFKKGFGFVIKRGTCKKYELSLKEIEEPEESKESENNIK